MRNVYQNITTRLGGAITLFSAAADDQSNPIRGPTHATNRLTHSLLQSMPSREAKKKKRTIDPCDRSHHRSDITVLQLFNTEL